MSTDNTSLFFVVHDPKIAALSLNEDKLKINQWAYQQKMFNPDTSIWSVSGYKVKLFDTYQQKNKANKDIDIIKNSTYH